MPHTSQICHTFITAKVATGSDNLWRCGCCSWLVHRRPNNCERDQGTMGCMTTRDALADRRLFGIDKAAWTEFLAILDRPAAQRPRLAQLFAEPSIFDEA